ncbi:hypothetical protein Bsel_2959 [[Bacillus] selenitireducens MLS10]|uniref:Uncharacterized protein n=1 Tax=Bacillus selenitireducens (strain ATCC 700615 / DSM 15326 / MLS10) TaxID=439292 RepID=D6XZU3_BACIE|nr:hypothetical protein Bsel_2959 [[Bacillus] selenitireducens MLS10]
MSKKTFLIIVFSIVGLSLFFALVGVGAVVFN